MEASAARLGAVSRQVNASQPLSAGQRCDDEWSLTNMLLLLNLTPPSSKGRTQHIFKEELHYQLSVDATNYIHIPTKTTRMNPFTTFFQDNSAEPVPHTAEEIMKRARDIVVTI